MKMHFNRLVTIGAFVFLSGCVIAPTPTPTHYRADVIYSDAPPPPVITNQAPPLPLVELIGTPPVPGYFWISGTWLWEGNHPIWHPGHWAAPRAGYTWVPHYWHQEENEWHMDGGHWKRH